MVSRIISQAQFTGQARGGLALADPTQQENHLCWSQLLVRKHSARIDRVHRLTVTAPAHRNMTTALFARRNELASRSRHIVDSADPVDESACTARPRQAHRRIY